MPDLDPLAAALDAVNPNPAPVDPAAAAVAQVGNGQMQSVQANLFTATAKDPDAHAKALQLADQFKVPVDVLESARDQFQQANKLNAADIQSMMRYNPALMTWLTNQDNASIGQDDLHHLARIDAASQNLAATLAPPVDDREAMPWWSGVIGRNARIGTGQLANHLLVLPAMVDAGVRSVIAGGGIGGADPTALSSDRVNQWWSPLARVYAINDTLRAEEHAAATYRQTFAQTATGGLVSMVANPENTLLPLGAGSLAAQAATKAGIPAVTQAAKVATAALTGAALVQAEQAAGAALSENVTKRQQERNLGDTGPVLPDLRGVENAAAQAAIGFLAGYLGGLRGILRPFNPGNAGIATTGAIVGEAGKDAAVQAAVGGAQGAAGAAASGAIGETPMPSGPDLLTAAGSGAAGGAVMGFGGTALHLRVEQQARLTMDAAAATKAAGYVAQAGMALHDSQAFRRNGLRVLSLVKDAIGRGDPNVYLQADAVPEIAKAAGLTPEVLASRMGITLDAMDEAKATGTPLSVDLLKALHESSVKPESVAALVDHVRTRPDAPSLKDAQAFAAAAPEELVRLQSEADRAMNEATPPDVGQRIYEDMKRQLEAAGQSPDVAHHNATLVASHFAANEFWMNQGRSPDAEHYSAWDDYARAQGLSVRREGMTAAPAPSDAVPRPTLWEALRESTVGTDPNEPGIAGWMLKAREDGISQEEIGAAMQDMEAGKDIIGTKAGQWINDHQAEIIDEAHQQRQALADAAARSEGILHAATNGTEGADGGDPLFQSVSTRFPTAAKRTEDPLVQNLIIDLAAVKADPKAFAKNAAVVSRYPGTKPLTGAGSKSPEKIVEAFIKQVVDNLLWLHDQVPESIRNRSKLWYDGARVIAEKWAAEYDRPVRNIAAVLATLSPQKDWYQNVNLARRVLDVVTGKDGTGPWSKEMDATAARIWKPKDAKLLAEVKGKKFSELQHDDERAMWIRTYDEAHADPSFPIVTPEGTLGEMVKNADGKKNSRRAWGDLRTIAKAVRAASATDQNTISTLLGQQHKVRNFYNNIFDPNSKDGHVTIDTHAVAAGLLRPLAGEDKEVEQNFGGAGSASSSIIGSNGTYGIYAEAYRRAAEMRGILPREMQSITWEAVRGLFPDDFKNEKNKGIIDAIWKSYRKGDISLDQARAEVERVTGGIHPPTWWRPDLGRDAEARRAAYQKEVSGSRGAGGTRASGDRAGSAADGQEDLGRQLYQAAFHATGNTEPYERFRYDRVGGPGGEGAQAFGWGLYFTGKKAIADWYREKLGRGESRTSVAMNGKPIDPILHRYAMDLANGRDSFKVTQADIDNAIQNHKDAHGNDYTPWHEKIQRENYGKLLGNDITVKTEKPGKTYHVEIPEDHEYLQWDKPLYAQDEKVKTAVEKILGHKLPSEEEVKSAKYLNAHKRDALMTGRQFYELLSARLSPEATNPTDGWRGPFYRGDEGHKAASDALREAGIPGIRYLASESRAKGEGVHNYVIFDDSRIKILRYEQRGAPSDARGSYEPATRIIRLFDKEDLSTFSHEFGHYMLEHLAELAARPDAPQKIRDDYTKVREFIGADDPKLQEGTNPAHIPRESHERWARAFELFLREGKAPSPALSATFARIRSWMVYVYKTITDLHFAAGHEVKLSPEIREVMNRLLATEDEINAAKVYLGNAALFADSKIANEAGMTPEQKAAYSEAVAAGQQHAADSVAAEQFHAAEQTRKALASEAYKKIADQEAAQVDQLPEYVAMQAIRQVIATETGGVLPHGLDREAIKELANATGSGDMARLLSNKKLLAPRGSEGIDPQLVASMLGYPSAHDMVMALIAAPNRDKLIAQRAKARMRAEHPDLLAPAQPPEKRIANGIDAGRVEVLRREIEALSRKTGQKVAPVEIVRQVAQQRIGSLPVGKLDATKFRAAEVKANKEALVAAAKGDFAKALEEKQRELLNRELRRATEQAKEDATKMQDHLRSLMKPEAQERIGKAGGWKWVVMRSDGTVVDTVASLDEARKVEAANPGTTVEQTSGYLDRINTILAKYDLRPLSAKALAKRQSYQQWADMMAADGFDVPEVDPILSDPRSNLRELTTEELRAVHDSIAQIENLAKRRNKLLASQRKQAFDDAKAELLSTITASAKNVRLVKAGRTLVDDLRHTVEGWIGALERLGDMLHALDGGKDGGIAWELFKRPFDEAANAEAAMQQEAARQLADAFAKWEKAGDRSRLKDGMSKKMIPAIGRSLSRLERIVVALNWGNEGNRERLKAGFHWEDGQVQSVLDTLDATDAALVHDLATIINAKWSEIAAKQQRITGVKPEKVQGAPTTIGGVQSDGWYYPVIYDRMQSSDAVARDLAQVADAVRRGAFTAATTRRGHTKARTEGTGAPLSLDIADVSRHLNQVYHDLTHHEALIDASRFLRDKEVKGAIEAHYGPQMVRALAGALERIGGASIRDVDGMESAVKMMTANVGRAAMGYNVWTAVQNVVGFTQSMELVGPLRFLRALAPMVGTAQGMQSLRSFVHSKSEFMVRRSKLSGERPAEQTATGTGALGRDLPDALRPYAMMEAIQQLVDLPTWKAAYDHALELGNPDDKAAAMADQSVVDAQGGKESKDKAAVLEGSEYKKLMTMFYGYFNTTFNLTSRAIRRTEFTNPASVAHLAASFALLYAVPTAMTLAGMALLRPNHKDDDKPLPGRLTAETLAMMLSTVPVVRELSAGAKGLLGDGSPYNGPASMRGVDTLNQFLTQIGGRANGTGGDHLGKSAAQVAGLLTGLPTVQIQRTLDGILYDMDHQTANPVPVMFGAPK